MLSQLASNRAAHLNLEDAVEAQELKNAYDSSPNIFENYRSATLAKSLVHLEQRSNPGRIYHFDTIEIDHRTFIGNPSSPFEM